MSFQCKENCDECCGIIPFDPILAKQTEHLAQVKPEEVLKCNRKIYVITKDGRCVYLNRKTKKCMIYDMRPKICRMYGLTPNIPCPYVKEDGTKRNEKEVEETKKQIALTVEKALRLVRQNG